MLKVKPPGNRRTRDRLPPPDRTGRERGMLMPQAYDESLMPALRLARSGRWVRRIGRLLALSLIVALFVVALSPWQQSVRGTGSVIAYDPTERPQPVEAPIKGRIVRFGDGIVENARVNRGDLIAEINDLDEERLPRLERQLVAADSQVQSLESLVEASERNADAARRVVESQRSQVRTYGTVREQVVAEADAQIESAIGKVDSFQQKVQAAEAALRQVEADYRRNKTLFDENIISQLKFQEIERKYREGEAKLSGARADLAAAKADLNAKRSSREAKSQKADVDIDYAQALLDKAQGDVEKADSEVQKAVSELRKAEKERLELESKIAQQRTQSVVATADGILTQITPNQGGQVLKEGEVIAIIVPDNADRAVQIWLDGNDAALVSAGRHVRLQFEGWPAVQFTTGWPSVAVGTFGGTVASVDATDNGKGKFRVLVRPDESGDSTAWPEERFLRQGVRANGWVLLEVVPLWFELWRQINGFPPVVDVEQEKVDKPRLPKPK